MKQTTQQWLELALTDLKNCEKILDDSFLTNIVSFHAQQTAEKCFKAILEEKNLEIPRIHMLVRLYRMVESYFVTPLNLCDLQMLDSVYTNSRYPIDLGMIEIGKPSLEESLEFYKAAKFIYDKTIEIL